MNSYLNALDEGYSPEDVLGYLSQAIPKLSKSISKAKSAGYTVQQILGYLSKTVNPKKNLGKSESEIHEANRVEDAQLAKYGLGMVATAVAAPFAASAARSALARALPQSLSPLADALGNMPDGVSPSNAMNMQENLQQLQQTPVLNNQIVSQQPPANQVAASIPEPSNIMQQKEIANPKEYLEKKGVLNEVIDSLKKGNNPLQVATQIGIKKTGRAKIDPEMLKNIEEFSALPQEEAETNLLPKPTELVEKPIEKSSLVVSPQGLGTVKEIRNGKAIVDVDGKKHQVDEDELIQSPLPEKDLADLYDDLIKGIEEETGEDVSRMVQWAGYDPETNTLQFLPHDGDLYTYTDLSPERAAVLQDILSVRKTSGSNFIGAWKAGSKSPIGAAMSKLIRELQSERGGKGKEYEQKFPTVYSAYSPAITAKKKKKKKKK